MRRRRRAAVLGGVIDQVLRLNTDPASPLQGTVNPAKIGVARPLMGGITALSVAGNTCCHDGTDQSRGGAGRARDPRQRAVLLAHHHARPAGPRRRRLQRHLRRRSPAYAGAPPPRFLLTVLGGDHGAPYSGDAGDPQAAVVSDAILDFLDHYLHDDAGGLARLQARASAPGVAKLELEL